MKATVGITELVAAMTLEVTDNDEDKSTADY